MTFVLVVSSVRCRVDVAPCSRASVGFAPRNDLVWTMDGRKSSPDLWRFAEVGKGGGFA
jgi:hypothetical protein